MSSRLHALCASSFLLLGIAACDKSNTAESPTEQSTTELSQPDIQVKPVEETQPTMETPSPEINQSEEREPQAQQNHSAPDEVKVQEENLNKVLSQIDEYMTSADTDEQSKKSLEAVRQKVDAMLKELKNGEVQPE